jgi:hypothetical protein
MYLYIFSSLSIWKQVAFVVCLISLHRLMVPPWDGTRAGVSLLSWTSRLVLSEDFSDLDLCDSLLNVDQFWF